MNNAEFLMVYPEFQIIDGRGILPRVTLPLDYIARVQIFYKHGKRGEIEEYALELEQILAQQNMAKIGPGIRLQWDEKKGLVNISVGTGAGLDLVEEGWPRFQEHNLNTVNGFPAFCVASKYVSELLKF